MRSPDVAVVIGTRPELIKLAPVVLELRRRGARTQVIATGQHGDVLRPLFAHFGIEPDVTLVPGVEARRSLNDLLSALMTDLQTALDGDVDAVVVQGDTTSALAGALCGFHRGRPVAHLEAGLRTHDLSSPFPEEGNRRLIGQVADLHWAPTEGARRALLAEGVPEGRIFVTGNTVIDALRFTEAGLPEAETGREASRSVLITAHRRESWGRAMDNILLGVARSAVLTPDVEFSWVAHPNPQLRERVVRALGHLPNVTILEPLPYVAMIAALRSAALVLTDSGGLQEEAPSFGTPVLVMRDTTERPEAVEAGTALLIGTEAEAIVHHVTDLLGDADRYGRMSSRVNPFGDGRAADRAVTSLVEHLSDR